MFSGLCVTHACSSCSWAARYNTLLSITLTPEVVVFLSFFLSFHAGIIKSCIAHRQCYCMILAGGQCYSDHPESSFQSQNIYFTQQRHPHTRSPNSVGEKMRFHIVEMFWTTHCLYSDPQCLTGIGIRLSWLTVVVPRNTSPMAAPCDWKPPAVPTLMIKSG